METQTDQKTPRGTGTRLCAAQKEEIAQLRFSGKSYTEIAELTGISRSTIQAHCLRHALGGVGSRENAFRLCKCCNKVIAQNPKRKEKLFCSDACRFAWWRDHKDAMNKKAFYKLTCQHCGKEFESYGNQTRKFCSQPCFRKSRVLQEASHDDQGTTRL